MLQNNLHESGRLQFSPVGLMLGLGFALYVYRFPVGDGNISVLRVAMLFLGIYLAFCVFFQKRRISAAYCLLIISVLFLVSINFYYYLFLNEYPIPQQEIISHSVNLFLFLQIVLFIDSRNQLISILNSFILTSLVAIAIGYFGFFYEAIPFEYLLRVYGPETAVETPYIIQDGDFFRFSGPFMDPNFFGVYLLTVLIFSVWLYFNHVRSNFYLMMSVLALATLFLTLSRTAMIGLFIFFLVFIFAWRSRMKVIILTTIGFLIVVSAVTIFVVFPDLIDRLLNTESASDRLYFIFKGMDAFIAYPLLGSGPINIVDEETGIATAHLMYLTVLAKFGLVGAFVYLFFIFYPVINVIFAGRRFIEGYRQLILWLYLPLFIIYFLYDFLTFLEFQYLIFSVGYSVVFLSYSKKAHLREDRKSSMQNEIYASHKSESPGAL